MEEIIFASGSVPVAVAARVYGKDASWIRAGIVSGWLPIGKATRSGKLVTNLTLSTDASTFIFRLSSSGRRPAIYGGVNAHEYIDTTGTFRN